MTFHIKTERLILREFRPGDLNDMFELHADPEVHRYLGNRTINTLEETKSMIEAVRQQYIDHGIGRWAGIKKDDRSLIGWAGLKYEWNPRDNLYYYDLGYRLKKQ